MAQVSTDRAEIMHFAGFHHLSPALDEGKPAFSASAADGLARCGWEAFFRAMTRGSLALAFDPTDAGSARFVLASGTPRAARRRVAVGGALEHARRFFAAISGR